ncbi:MAG TPA: hypothetical protein VGM38_09360 [Pseudolysinimonas sp.]|jgi:ADP-heptose:LPS heptosyltransferase
MKSKPWMGLSRCGGIGDNLMAAALLPALADKYQVDLLTNDVDATAVFENNPFISKLTKVKDDDIPKDSMPAWQGWFAKRAREYEKFVNLSHSCETLVALPQSQTAFYWPDEWRRKHCAANYLDAIAEICGVEPDFGEPLFYPTEEEWKKAAETKAKVGHRVIGWSVAGSRLDKYHPRSPMIVGRLIHELGLPVIMFGAGGREASVVKATQEHLEKTYGTLNGLHEARTCYEADEKTVANDKDGKSIHWPVRRSLTQLLTCDLVITPDTGLLWAAGFEDMPKIALLSHATPENITKYFKNTVALHAARERVSCFPCHRLHDTIEFCHANKAGDGAACIADISVEMVLDTARTLLEMPSGLEALEQRLKGNITIHPGSFAAPALRNVA